MDPLLAEWSRLCWWWRKACAACGVFTELACCSVCQACFLAGRRYR